MRLLNNQMKLVEKKTNILSNFIVRFQWHENNSIFFFEEIQETQLRIRHGSHLGKVFIFAG